MTELSRGANVSRVFLVIFNLIFTITGLCILVFGVILEVGGDALGVFRMILDQIPDLTGITAAVIGLGCAIFIVGILGLTGACCKVSWMLCIYASIVLVITLTEAVLIALLMTGKLNDLISDGLSKLTSQYKVPDDSSNLDKTDTTSRSVDELFVRLQCCDYTNTTEFPPSCCKDVTIEALKGGNITALSVCVNSPNSTNSNMEQDCYEAVINLIKKYQLYVISVSVASFCVQIICVACAIWICIEIHKQIKVEEIS